MNAYVFPGAKRIYGVEEIESLVCQEFDISPSDLMLPSRESRICVPRQVVVYFIRKLLGMDYYTLARRYGKKSHATIRYSCQRVQNLIDTQDWLYYPRIAALHNKLTRCGGGG